MKVTDVRLLSCFFKMNRNFEGHGEMELGADIEFGSNFDEATNIVTGVIKAIVSEDEHLPYSFVIEMGGKFALEEEEVEHIQRLCMINIPAILLPYLRETVADITRRSGNQPMHLATINFVDVAKAKSKDCKAE